VVRLIGFASLAALAMVAAQPSLTAPVRDGHFAALGERLFPALTSIDGATLPDSGGDAGAISTMLSSRRQRMAACNAVPECVISAALWTDAERDALAKAAELVLSKRNRPNDQVPDDGVRPEVEREIAGLNSILKVYAMGMTPRYPRIDGPDPSEGGLEARQRIVQSVEFSQTSQDDPVTVLDPSIGLSLALLDVAGRDDAAAWEPLDSDAHNGQALALAKRVDWSRYRYTAIIVPGEGPDDLLTPLSPMGKARIRLAAGQYRDGVAPFIIVSGGAVHPRGTHHVEASEMRRGLIERFGIPTDHILIDPYARHTTTNLRNAARLLMALHAPMDRDALVVTSAEQSRYIESPGFAERSQHELGYQPGTLGKRLSSTALPFRPAVLSRRHDPLDPLDP
jgi:hypothetical protein